MADWKETLAAARKEQNELIQQRDVLDSRQADLDIEREKLEKRILQLQKTIESLSELVGESRLSRTLGGRNLLVGSYDNLKLAEAVRKVLQSADRYWTPIDVRNALQAQQYDLSGYTNALASIHAVLKRILEAGEAMRIAGADGKAMYRWKNVTVTPTPGTLKSQGHAPEIEIKVKRSDVEVKDSRTSVDKLLDQLKK